MFPIKKEHDRSLVLIKDTPLYCIDAQSLVGRIGLYEPCLEEIYKFSNAKTRVGDRLWQIPYDSSFSPIAIVDETEFYIQLMRLDQFDFLEEDFTLNNLKTGSLDKEIEEFGLALNHRSLKHLQANDITKLIAFRILVHNPADLTVRGYNH